jgi:ferritin-like metal-binding protein YciE
MSPGDLRQLNRRGANQSVTDKNKNMKTLKDLFLGELEDMYDAEHRIAKALPKMAKAATCPDLKAALLAHLKETEGQVKKLEQVFQAFDETARSKPCEATKGLLEEGDEIAAQFKGSPAINAALISAAQKVEHYEIASYGCLHEWARLLGNPTAAGLLEEILKEEKAANEILTELARASSNEEALGESDDDESDETPDKSPEKRRHAHPAVTANGNRDD